MVNGWLNSCMPGGVATAPGGQWHAKSISNVLERALRTPPPEGERIRREACFLLRTGPPNAVLYTSNPVSNFAVVTARGTSGIMRLWDNLVGVGAS